jgi:LysR family transcriptional regulator, benzoate and cis,cis-muconate-responsive activator of ben and cat genes
MELRQLRYFIAVAEELHFTRAAARLRMAQPPLSRQIQKLEAETGIHLFRREHGKVSLTDAGRVFLEEAKTVVAQAAYAVDSARRAQEGKTGLLRIGIAYGLGDKVNRVLARHSKTFPGVEIECKDIASTPQNEALRLRAIDVGFMRPPIDSVHLVSQRLFQEKFLVVLPKSSPFAKRKMIRLEMLANEPLLVIERNISSGTYDKTLELYRKANVHPKIIQTHTLPYQEAGAILVASGKGVYVAIGTNPCHPRFADRVTAIPIDEPDATFDVHIAWRRGDVSPSVLDFLDTVREVFKVGPARSSAPNRLRRGKDVFF